ncbi:MAG: hypothetical protein ABFD59_00695 [Smithella sp.]|jgi:hypothetical protein
MKNKFSMTILFCAWLLAAWFMLPQHALADPPKNIALGYDMPTQTLTVTITHKSSFTGIHYIKQVAIKKNNEPADIKSYTSQTGKETFAYTYKVPAAPNDVLEITVTCNIQGSKTATLKVE